MIISHKIELKPNNKAKSHFRKAFGCSRLAYNWGLAKWQEYYKQGKSTSYLDLKKEFNNLKKEEFPFVYEVSKYATQQPFINLNEAFQRFFRDLKVGKVSYPKFKRKKDNYGSYYIGGDQVVISDKPKISKKLKIQSNKKKYLKIPNFGYVKMKEELRFNGKINSVTISQVSDKYYASFSVEIDEKEYYRTHHKPINNNTGIGVDVGIESFITLANGIKVISPKPLNKLSRKLIRKSRQLSKRQHPKTKGDLTSKSNNYNKTALELSKLHREIANIRNDFIHKTTASLIRNYEYIAIEDLSVKEMMKNHHLARHLSDVSFYEFRRQLEYKADYNKRQIIYADKFYPSSKLCSVCGNHKDNLQLSDRVYRCGNCGNILDRDYNASMNLYHLIEKQIGKVLPEFTPADLTALLSCLAINNLTTSKVETGIQQKS